MDTLLPSPTKATAAHPQLPRPMGFAEAQRRFQEQFGITAGNAAARNPPSAPGESKHGCLTCLHHHVRSAVAARNHMLVSLGEARKYADELKIKSPARSEAFERVANSLSKALEIIEPLDLVSLVKEIPEVTGPGTELHKLLEELGFQEPPGCSCNATMAWMNEIGVEGCRQQIDKIVEKLKAAQALVGWADLAKGTWQALKKLQGREAEHRASSQEPGGRSDPARRRKGDYGVICLGANLRPMGPPPP